MQDIGDKSDNTAGSSGELPASEYNNHKNELQNSVEVTGQTLDTSDLFQLAKSMFVNGVSAHNVLDGGSANSVQLSPLTGGSGLRVPSNYSELNGAILRFEKSTPNTSSSVTVNFGQTGTELTAKTLVRPDGSAPEIGDVAGVCFVEWDNSNDRWVLLRNGGDVFIDIVSDSETYTPVFKNGQVILDTALGDASAIIDDPSFSGQTVMLSNNGTGFATFINANDFSYGIIVDTEHSPIIKAVADGSGGLKWDVGSQVSSKYVSGDETVTLYTSRRMCSINQGLVCGHLSSGVLQGSLVYARSFNTIPTTIEGGFTLVSGIPTSSWAGSNSTITATVNNAIINVYISASIAGNAVSCNVISEGEYE